MVAGESQCHRSALATVTIDVITSCVCVTRRVCHVKVTSVTSGHQNQSRARASNLGIVLVQPRRPSAPRPSTLTFPPRQDSSLKVDNMRPAVRTTRAMRAINVEEPDVVDADAGPRQSAGSSRTSTPVSDKGKKPRHRMTDKQLVRLEALYQEDTHPTREQKQALGDDVGM